MKLEKAHKVLLTIIAVPAALAALAGLYASAGGTVKGWAQEAGRAAVKAQVDTVRQEFTKAVQDLTSQQQQGNVYLSQLVEQNAHRECMELGPVVYASPAGEWSAISEPRRRAICNHEARYRLSVREWEQEGRQGEKPKPEEVP